MNVALVDHLACPRCGPAFGLVLLAREVRERRVRRGELGCPNCRDAFPVERGFADLRPPPRSPLRADPASPSEDASARSAPGAASGRGPDGGRAGDYELRIAAALGGAAAGSGVLVLSEGVRARVSQLRRWVAGAEVVVLARGGVEGAAEASVDARVALGISPMAVGAALPFRDGFAQGVVLARREWERLWREAVRVAAPGRPVVAVDAPRDARAALEGEGLSMILDADGWLAARRDVGRPGSPPPVRILP